MNAISPASPEPRRPRQRRKEARPSELTAAALELFVEKGFAATRLDDVAARAGVSKGTLYLYFDSKEALFKAVVEEAVVPLLLAAKLEISVFEGTSVDLLRRLIFGWWDQIGGTRLSGLPKLIIWRHSLHSCGHSADPELYLQTHFDLLVQGLRPQKGVQ